MTDEQLTDLLHDYVIHVTEREMKIAKTIFNAAINEAATEINKPGLCVNIMQQTIMIAKLDNLKLK